MKTTTISEFKLRANKLLQEIEDDNDVLIISRTKNQSSFVVLPMGEYESLQETAHLLSTPANALRLIESIKQVEAGKVVTIG